MPTISVIVPVYRVEPYLRRCVDSILAQTYSDLELILVDDGSPDGCPAICDEYAREDSRVHVIHKPNGGLSDARNAGLGWMFANSGSQYVTFIDSDDLVTADYLKRLYDVLQTSQADISVCMDRSFEDEAELRVQPGTTDPTAEVMSGREACMSIYRMDGKTSVMAWGKLYRSEIMRPLRYPVGRIHEDDATTPLAYYRADRVVFVKDRLYLYRQRDGSIMRQAFSARRFDGVEAVETCIQYFAQKQDAEMIKHAQNCKLVIQSKAIILAHYCGRLDQIPEQYYMSEWQALRNIRKWAHDDTYCWYLSLVHPEWEKPHAYLRKIRRMTGLLKET